MPGVIPNVRRERLQADQDQVGFSPTILNDSRPSLVLKGAIWLVTI